MVDNMAMDDQDVPEPEGPSRRLDELIGGGHEIAMLMTMIDGEHRSRPLTCGLAMLRSIVKGEATSSLGVRGPLV